MVASAVP